MIKIEPRRNPRKNLQRNLPENCPRLFVHTLKYSINPSDYFKSDERTVNIIAQNYAEAEKLLVNSIGKKLRFHITEHQESNFEVHAISSEMQDMIYNSLKA